MHLSPCFRIKSFKRGTAMISQAQQPRIASRSVVLTAIFLLGAALFWKPGGPAGGTTAPPDPAVDSASPATAGQQTAVIAGGCFWGIQAVFQHVKGVESATSGYSGGSAATAHYDQVSDGNTGHAE